MCRRTRSWRLLSPSCRRSASRRLRGLGAWGDGVINLEPKVLEPSGTAPVRSARALLDSAEYDAKNLSVASLKPGSDVRRAILRKRLITACTEEKVDAILKSKGGEALFARLWDDDATLEGFLLSGPVFNAPLALETLMTLFLNDEKEGWSKTDMGRKATVAVALNAQKGGSMTLTVRHWAAFRRIGMARRFVQETAKRDCREWHFIVRRPADPAETPYLNAQRRFPTRRASVSSLGKRSLSLYLPDRMSRLSAAAIKVYLEGTVVIMAIV